MIVIPTKCAAAGAATSSCSRRAVPRLLTDTRVMLHVGWHAFDGRRLDVAARRDFAAAVESMAHRDDITFATSNE
jgi:hypothetical protein